MFKLPIDFFFMLLYSQNIWGRSEAGLSRWPVTPETAGSSPVSLVDPVLVSRIGSFHIQRVFNMTLNQMEPLREFTFLMQEN